MKHHISRMKYDYEESNATILHKSMVEETDRFITTATNILVTEVAYRCVVDNLC